MISSRFSSMNSFNMAILDAIVRTSSTGGLFKTAHGETGNSTAVFDALKRAIRGWFRDALPQRHEA